MVNNLSVSRFEGNRRRYKKKKGSGICVYCSRKSKKGKNYCTFHIKKFKISYQKRKEFLNDLKIVEPKEKGFNGLSFRCIRCKLFYVEADGHLCQEELK